MYIEREDSRDWYKGVEYPYIAFPVARFKCIFVAQLLEWIFSETIETYMCTSRLFIT